MRDMSGIGVGRTMENEKRDDESSNVMRQLTETAAGFRSLQTPDAPMIMLVPGVSEAYVLTMILK